jgi:hypothetical protein
MATTYEKIATTTLGSAATSIDLTSIGSGYTDLRLVLNLIGTFSGAGLRFNSDSGSNYSMTYLNGDGASAISYQLSNQTRVNLGPVNVASSATIPDFIALDIFSYAGSTYKTFLNAQSYDNNGSGDVTRQVGLWRSTSAITSINITNMGSGNFNTGSIATIYGILKASLWQPIL